MGCCNNWIWIILIFVLFCGCDNGCSNNNCGCGCNNGGLFNNNNCGC